MENLPLTNPISLSSFSLSLKLNASICSASSPDSVDLLRRDFSSELGRSLPFRSSSGRLRRASDSGGRIAMPDKEAAVPKFGEWNDKDATPPNNYTAIFTRVQEERQELRARAPTLPRNGNSPSNQNHEHQRKICFCFPWPRK